MKEYLYELTLEDEIIQQQILKEQNYTNNLYNLHLQIEEEEKWGTFILKYPKKRNKPRKPPKIIYGSEKLKQLITNKKEIDKIWQELDNFSFENISSKNINLSQEFIYNNTKDKNNILIDKNTKSWKNLNVDKKFINKNDIINSLWENFNKDNLSIEDYQNKMIPWIIGKTNKYYFKLYKFFRNDLRELNKIIINNKPYYYNESAYWGLQNTYGVFQWCLQNYNINNKGNYDFARYLNFHINNEFIGCYRKALVGKLSRKTKNNPKKSFLIKEVVSLDNQNEKILKDVSEKIDNKCSVEKVDIKMQLKEFMKKYLTKDESTIFLFMLDRYYYGKEYTNETIACAMKISVRTVINYKKKVRELFIKYRKGELK